MFRASDTTFPAAQESAMPSQSTSDEVAIREVSDQQRTAMFAGDVETLDRLLADDFALTHISGYVQPQAEWLAQITSGNMQYHNSDEVSWSVTVDGDTAVVENHSHLDATIYETKRVWPIAFTFTMVKTDGRWVITQSVATTF
ncbi:MAG: nuclear transport factor 2 family protein [Propionibacteriaceae bacterium]|nr:nuclear transport factor 2 family protein [Propionibacteriaceae bacterium]